MDQEENIAVLRKKLQKRFTQEIKNKDQKIKESYGKRDVDNKS